MIIKYPPGGIAPWNPRKIKNNKNKLNENQQESLIKPEIPYKGESLCVVL